MLKYLNVRTTLVQGFICTFLVNTFGPLPLAQAQDILLPAPGIMVPLSPTFDPPILKGIKVNPENPFKFDFILDRGDNKGSNDALQDESRKLIKYFLASLTIPEKDLWVNLSPYEKDRIIPQSFGLTSMGRDLLAEDYMLKQIAASLIYPEGETGKRFWKRIYGIAAKKFGTTNVPINTFNKVWIVPEKAVVYENAKVGAAYVVESKLKVMLEEDYLSLSRHSEQSEESKSALRSFGLRPQNDVHSLASQIIREIVIPELTKEVNYGENFAQLRQVYNSLILATWYKKKIRDSILGQIYEDKNRVAGVNIDDPQEKEKIYQRYLRAFKKGVYNYIKEDTDPVTQQSVPRKYFSGGVPFFVTAGIERIINTPRSSMFTNGQNLEKIQIEVCSALHQSIVDGAMKTTGDQAMNLPQGVKSLVQKIQSAQQLDEFFTEMKYLKGRGAKFSENLMSVLETLTLLFGFESGPGLVVFHSHGSVFKNWQISEEEQEGIMRHIYSVEAYENSLDDISEVQDTIASTLSKISRNGIVISSRIKQYKSVIEKLRIAIARINGVSLEMVPTNTQQVLRMAIQLQERIKLNPTEYFDDVIGFNVGIDDSNMDDKQRTTALTEITSEIKHLLEEHPDWKVAMSRHEGVVKGYESVNIWISGLLNHRHFGALPVKVQVRFLSALKHEAAMRYVFKTTSRTTGKWKYPPWITEAEIDAAPTFDALRERLLENFKAHTKDTMPSEEFDLLKNIEWPSGLPKIYPMINELAASAAMIGDQAMRTEVVPWQATSKAQQIRDAVTSLETDLRQRKELVEYTTNTFMEQRARFHGRPDIEKLECALLMNFGNEFFVRVDPKSKKSKINDDLTFLDEYAKERWFVSNPTTQVLSVISKLTWPSNNYFHGKEVSTQDMERTFSILWDYFFVNYLNLLKIYAQDEPETLPAINQLFEIFYDPQLGYSGQRFSFRTIQDSMYLPDEKGLVERLIARLKRADSLSYAISMSERVSRHLRAQILYKIYKSEGGFLVRLISADEIEKRNTNIRGNSVDYVMLILCLNRMLAAYAKIKGDPQEQILKNQLVRAIYASLSVDPLTMLDADTLFSMRSLSGNRQSHASAFYPQDLEPSEQENYRTLLNDNYRDLFKSISEDPLLNPQHGLLWHVQSTSTFGLSVESSIVAASIRYPGYEQQTYSDYFKMNMDQGHLRWLQRVAQENGGNIDGALARLSLAYDVTTQLLEHWGDQVFFEHGKIDVRDDKIGDDTQLAADGAMLTLDHMLYTPPWLDDASFSLDGTKTPREIITHDPQVVDLIERLGTILAQYKENKNLHLNHKVQTLDVSEESTDDQNIRKAQLIIQDHRFNWDQLGDYQSGRSVWTSKGWWHQQLAPKNDIHISFQGEVIQGNISSYIESEIKDFIDKRQWAFNYSDHFVGNRGVPTAIRSLLVGYLFDLVLIENGIDAVDNGSGEFLIKNPRSIIHMELANPNPAMNTPDNNLFLRLSALKYSAGQEYPGHITAYNLFKNGNQRILASQVLVGHDQELGVVVAVDVGQFVLWELDDENQQGAIFSPFHGACVAVDIKARKGNKWVIGHAHLKSIVDIEDENKPEYFDGVLDTREQLGMAYMQFQRVLSYLKNPQLGLSDVELMITMEGNAAYGMPSKDILEKTARINGMTIRDVPREVLQIADTLNTSKQVIFRIIPYRKNPQIEIDKQEWGKPDKVSLRAVYNIKANTWDDLYGGQGMLPPHFLLDEAMRVEGDGAMINNNAIIFKGLHDLSEEQLSVTHGKPEVFMEDRIGSIEDAADSWGYFWYLASSRFKRLFTSQSRMSLLSAFLEEIVLNAMQKLQGNEIGVSTAIFSSKSGERIFRVTIEQPFVTESEWERIFRNSKLGLVDLMDLSVRKQGDLSKRRGHGFQSFGTFVREGVPIRLEYERHGSGMRTILLIVVDPAMKSQRVVKIRGGIDLTPANKVLQTQNGGIGIKFHISAAQLAQWQNAPGVMIESITIQPLQSLAAFLGINQ